MIKHHVKHPAYPCREVNGLVYAYLGPRERMPLLPNVPWIALPEGHVCVEGKFINECNWLQALEGDCDSAHSAYLHRTADRLRGQMRTRMNAPRFEVDVTRWGVRAAALYPAKDGATLVRTNGFTMPCIGHIPNGRTIDGKLDGFHTIYQVPVDDYTVARYDVQAEMSRPVDDSYTFGLGSRRRSRQEVGPDFRKLANRRNDYLIDREKQRSAVVWCGIDAGNHTQDACVTETMGAISDRTQEHLGVVDSHIVAVRQFLLRAVKEFQQGADPPGVAREPAQNDFSDLYFLSGTIPDGVPWKAMAGQVTTYASVS